MDVSSTCDRPVTSRGRPSRASWIAGCLALIVFAPSSWTQRLVPDQYATIQLAIDAALPGETVFVAPGTYPERIDFLGKDLVVTSVEGPSLTIIDGELGDAGGSVVTFVGGESEAAVLSGFTLRGGRGTLPDGDGGGVYCSNSSPTLFGNVVRDNVVEGRGGGVFCLNASPRVESNEIVSNSAAASLSDSGGGAIYCEGSAARVMHNLIANNASFQGGSPGIHLVNSPGALIVGNTITDNGSMSGGGGGIACVGGSSATVRGNTIRDNYAAGPGGGVYVSASDPHIDGNLIASNATEQSGFTAGGGVFCSGSAAIISANTIRANTVVSGGGAGLALVDFTGSVVDNVVAQHSAITGAAIFYEAQAPCEELFGFVHNTIVSNTGLGAAIDTFGPCAIEVDNSILWDNAPFSLEFGHTVIGSSVQWGYPGNAIDDDPLFVDLVELDVHLRHDSPCRDTAALLDVGLAVDFEGDPRVVDALPDMGADEFRRRLYLFGDASPSALVAVRLVGEPALVPTWLWLGSGLLPSPLVLASHGAWYLEAPLLGPLDVGGLPPSGSLSLELLLPDDPVVGYLQANVGQLLTNALVIDTRVPGLP